jgi:hypothetical protein
MALQSLFKANETTLSMNDWFYANLIATPLAPTAQQPRLLPWTRRDILKLHLIFDTIFAYYAIYVLTNLSETNSVYFLQPGIFKRFLIKCNFRSIIFYKFLVNENKY